MFSITNVIGQENLIRESKMHFMGKLGLNQPKLNIMTMDKAHIITLNNLDNYIYRKGPDFFKIVSSKGLEM